MESTGSVDVAARDLTVARQRMKARRQRVMNTHRARTGPVREGAPAPGALQASERGPRHDLFAIGLRKTTTIRVQKLPNKLADSWGNPRNLGDFARRLARRFLIEIPYLMVVVT